MNLQKLASLVPKHSQSVVLKKELMQHSVKHVKPCPNFFKQVAGIKFKMIMYNSIILSQNSEITMGLTSVLPYTKYRLSMICKSEHSVFIYITFDVTTFFCKEDCSLKPALLQKL